MSRAEQRIDTCLDTEQRMPDQITHAADCEHHYPDHRQRVASRQSTTDRIAFRKIPAHHDGKKSAYDCKSAVEHRVPGRKKAIIDFVMIVRPAIYENANHE